MFTKLLKHELKAQRGIFTVLSLAALGAGLLGSLMLWLILHLAQNGSSNIDATMLGTIFASLTLMGSIFAIGAYVIAVSILLIMRFYQHHFSDEGYLTFTLPATTHQHLLSSIVSIAIWSVVSIVIAILGFMMIFTPVVNLEGVDLSELGIVFEIYTESFGADGIILQVFSFISSTAYSLVLPLVAITMGALLAKKHKLLAAFGIYYGLNMAVSIITGVASIFTTLSDLLILGASGESAFLFTTLVNIFLYLGLSIGGYFLMHHLVDKKLNLP